MYVSASARVRASVCVYKIFIQQFLKGKALTIALAENKYCQTMLGI